MDDLELINLASKASGFEYTYNYNPLVSDALALRLAVKLEMLLDLCGDETAAYCQEWCREKKENDPYAATRRAIVRAAAEIGRNMK